MNNAGEFDPGMTPARLGPGVHSSLQGSDNVTGAAARIRRVVLAGSFGTIVEYFDFGVYAFLATTIADVFFPSGDRTAALLYTLGVFGASFVLRPVGGILIGHLSDRYGRRPALMTAVIGMACASTLIGVLPPHASIGLLAPVLLLLLRCIQGLSAGGEMGSAAAYVAEVAPVGKRGFLTSLIQVSTVIGTMLGSLTVALLHMALTHEQVLAWGWRIPFLLSLPLGIITLLLRRHMEESRQFAQLEEHGAVARIPALAVLSSNPRGVLSVFGLSLGVFASYYLVFTYMATYLQQQKVMSPGMASWSTTVALLLAAVMIPFWAKVSDRVGRKPLLIGVCVANLVVAYPAFILMTHSATSAFFAQLVLGQIEATYLSVTLATFCEMFPARVRASGLSLGFNIASIVSGGTAPYVAAWLIATMHQSHAPAWMLIGTALISLGTSLTIRETAGRPMPMT